MSGTLNYPVLTDYGVAWSINYYEEEKSCLIKLVLKEPRQFFIIHFNYYYPLKFTCKLFISDN